MVTHSSILAWRIPWTEKPGGLQSIGSQRIRYDRSVYQSLSTHAHEEVGSVRFLQSPRKLKFREVTGLLLVTG